MANFSLNPTHTETVTRKGRQRNFIARHIHSLSLSSHNLSPALFPPQINKTKSLLKDRKGQGKGQLLEFPGFHHVHDGANWNGNMWWQSSWSHFHHPVNLTLVCMLQFKLITDRPMIRDPKGKDRKSRVFSLFIANFQSTAAPPLNFRSCHAKKREKRIPLPSVGYNNCRRL